ncbi:porin family protein [Rhodophyticola sp. CCM32]|uniref:outer membrane protein n=1 Tax=Rhodophyticola sp. CCM32 TaxID=2916397 RepID=UPI00107FBE9C|nr:porin family protein [Rhodophyticola sp. CCM32]QBX99592.1 porin family protein [Rhodophyticola sp. CCM32]
MSKFIKTLTAAAAVSAAVVGTASAQDALQWQGFYGGLEIQSINPDMSSLNLPFGSDENVVLFGGYNHALGGDWVVGGELSYGSDATATAIPGLDLTLEDTITLRGRVGYTIGNVLLYGSLGYVDTDVSLAGLSGDLSADGPVFGLGFEAMIANNISARIEYSRSSMDLSGGGVPPGFDIDTNAVSLGVAYHF